jgi:hypothetical protein
VAAANRTLTFKCDSGSLQSATFEVNLKILPYPPLDPTYIGNIDCFD